MTSQYIAIRLDADNDTNGNPRRVYVVYDVTSANRVYGGSLIAAIDEGYMGIRALNKQYGDAIYLGAFKTTPKEYRDLIRLGEKLKLNKANEGA